MAIEIIELRQEDRGYTEVQISYLPGEEVVGLDGVDVSLVEDLKCYGIYSCGIDAERRKGPKLLVSSNGLKKAFFPWTEDVQSIDFSVFDGQDPDIFDISLFESSLDGLWVNVDSPNSYKLGNTINIIRSDSSVDRDVKNFLRDVKAATYSQKLPSLIEKD